VNIPFKPRLALCLAALAAFADEPKGEGKAPGFRERLAHHRSTVRAEAAKAPPESLSVDDLKALGAALNDPDITVRGAAVEGLKLRAKVAGLAGARLLAAVAADPRNAAQGAAAAALVAYGDAALVVLRPSLLEKDVFVAVRPWELLARADDRFALGLLRHALLHDTDPAVRAQAAAVLRRLKFPLPDVIDDLWTVVKEEDAPAPVRASAIGAFARLARMEEGKLVGADVDGGRSDRILKAIPVIKELGSDPDPAVQAASKEALAIFERKVSPR
jgi:hypothetical protein